MGCVGLSRSVRRDRRFVVLIAAAALIAPAAQAAVIISSGATQNMSCSSGVCVPTASKAVLNAGDLESLLASGNATVTTTGQGVQAHDIDVKAPVGWSSTSVLTLDAHRSIAVDQPVSVAGLAGLVLNTNDGGSKGSYTFGAKGYATFANLSSQLSINGVAYTLVSDVETINGDPGGDFALAANYDAGKGGSHSVTVTFTGIFEGLGNVISNFTWGGSRGNFGLFAEVGAGGTLRDIGLVNADVYGDNTKNKYLPAIGTLAGSNGGTILFSYATGTVTDVTNKAAVEGGLVGFNGQGGTIANSHAAVSVSAAMGEGEGGGLVGYNLGSVSESYATGAISGNQAGGLFAGSVAGSVVDSYATGTVKAGNGGNGGGLAGNSGSTIGNCYATGNVAGGSNADIGGLIGANYVSISSSYSTGQVRGGTGSLIGGLIGNDQSQSGSLDDTYWDTDTSGITDPSQGAGRPANDPGITGLTTAQFQSGLPAGFDPKVWSEKPNINGGLPYLLANPPPK